MQGLSGTGIRSTLVERGAEGAEEGSSPDEVALGLVVVWCTYCTVPSLAGAGVLELPVEGLKTHPLPLSLGAD